MSIREEQEEWEREFLSPYASLSCNSLGRDRDEPQCDIRPVYQRDRDRILHSKAFRRMKQKTQVFLAPLGDHYRTRLTHTLEVSQIGRTIARALRLNEDLAEAIALGHDIGHAPFGHAGERALNDVCPEGFSHSEQSVRVAQVLEKDGRGLNLTREVQDGMLNHGTNRMPMTMEGKVIRLADKIAYINHDIDDAIRGQIIREEELPDEYTDVLGHRTKERLNTLIHDVIYNSLGKPDICMSGRVEEAMHGLRQYMFDEVYTNPKAKNQEGKAQNLLRQLYEYYMKNPSEMTEEYVRLLEGGLYSRERFVCDYISGMSDQYAIEIYEELFIPKAWKVF